MCNEDLGGTVESRAMSLVGALLGEMLPEKAEETVQRWSIDDGAALADWCCLRALELNFILERSKIDAAKIDTADQALFWDRLHLVARGKPALFSGSESVEVAFAKIAKARFGVTSTFVDSRLVGAKGPRAFQLGIQVNHLILVYRYLPFEVQTRRFGRAGLCVFPRRMPDERGVLSDDVPWFEWLDGAMRVPIIAR
jgi:hypothetical protein